MGNGRYSQILPSVRELPAYMHGNNLALVTSVTVSLAGRNLKSLPSDSLSGWSCEIKWWSQPGSQRKHGCITETCHLTCSLVCSFNRAKRLNFNRLRTTLCFIGGSLWAV
ncbi:hypothetical protein KIL84_023235 [Mauremys mutica]|uniref:Uncharacterized protein n=1 Tax=Mauremys mutica TaxID=74926 RepID=A0A9D4ARB7_9SAUR|nr:hypothetical protein KIL84_023235 [Mauremys mutica]